jgi:multiple sugar transport system ATP-binding protein
LSNLDAALRVNTRSEIIKQHHRLGSTMIYVTHDQVEAMTMGTRICVMNAGEVAQIGVPLEVYWQPANTFVARFLGAPPMNLFTVPLSDIKGDGAASVNGPALTAPLTRWSAAALAPFANREVILGVRAEDLHLSTEALDGAPSGSIRGRVTAVEPLGAETLVLVETAGGIECIARLPRHVTAATDQAIELFFAASATYLFDSATGRAVPAAVPPAVVGTLPLRKAVQ